MFDLLLERWVTMAFRIDNKYVNKEKNQRYQKLRMNFEYFL